MKQFKKEHYEKIFAKPKQSDMDKVKEFLQNSGIPFKLTSQNGITSSIVIHFGDSGERDVQASKESQD